MRSQWDVAVFARRLRRLLPLEHLKRADQAPAGVAWDDDVIDVPADDDYDVTSVPAHDDVTNLPVYVTSVSSVSYDVTSASAVSDDVIIPQGVQNSSDYYDIAELSPVVSFIS